MSEFMILLLVGSFAIPFLVGLIVNSPKRGLIALAVLPAISFGGGFARWGTCLALGHTNDTTHLLTAGFFAALGIYLAYAFGLCWGLGRFIRKRLRVRSVPAIPATIAVPSHAVETAHGAEATKSAE